MKSFLGVCAFAPALGFLNIFVFGWCCCHICFCLFACFLRFCWLFVVTLKSLSPIWVETACFHYVGYCSWSAAALEQGTSTNTHTHTQPSGLWLMNLKSMLFSGLYPFRYLAHASTSVRSVVVVRVYGWHGYCHRCGFLRFRHVRMLNIWSTAGGLKLTTQ